MKRAIFLVGVLVAATTAVQAQDAVKADPAHYKVLIDNPSVRVLDINYAPGGKSVMHEHPDAIVVPLTASKVEFGLPDGKRRPRAWRRTVRSIHRPANTIRITWERLRCTPSWWSSRARSRATRPFGEPSGTATEDPRRGSARFSVSQYRRPELLRAGGQQA